MNINNSSTQITKMLSCETFLNLKVVTENVAKIKVKQIKKKKD